ncbi:PSME3-interacting protein [Onthophagus taurus]|uniref:PSME3-interacting protein n=1 Tax=Onthophagus taurus TaxID=166361 RepID=UPI000C20D7F4|nr:protein FAM192A [Onthophagus taurus]
MSSGFITETEAVEVRNRRQAEWERVRKADDPIERPEEPHDHRSLYEKLQEQKQKKDLEYEEAHKLKNMIKGLDDDEIEFLDLVDRTKLAADRRKNIEEEQELNDYRNRVASLQEKSLDNKLQAEIQAVKPKVIVTNKKSQTKLLKGVVVKKTEAIKRKHDEIEESNKLTHHNKCEKSQRKDESKKDEANPHGTKRDHDSTKEVDKLTCIGILPGLGCYNDSSSNASSDSDQDDSCLSNSAYDFLGRKLILKEKKQGKVEN